MASTTSRAMPPARPMVFASEPVTLLPTWLRASAAPPALRIPVRIAVRPAADSQPARVDSHEKPPNSSFWRARRDGPLTGRPLRSACGAAFVLLLLDGAHGTGLLFCGGSRHDYRIPSPSASIRSLRTCSET